MLQKHYERIAETLPNPKLIPFPIAEVAAIGRKFGIPLIMDNTAAPTLVRPFDHGAAVVMHSATKYIGGHGTSIGGVVIDGGNFDWEAHADRQPALNTPDPSYHGAVWSQAAKPLGPIAYILKMRVTLLRDLGAALSPFNAFLFLQGIETLPLRMREHSRNALAVADFLATRKDVTRVIHPAHHTGRGRRADRPLHAARARRTARVRADRWRRSRPQIHRCVEDVLPRGEYRRRTQPGDPSGQHDPFPVDRGGTVRHRHNARIRPSVGGAWSISTTS